MSASVWKIGMNKQSVQDYIFEAQAIRIRNDGGERNVVWCAFVWYLLK